MVFKVQAGMDKNHRDSLAFMRIVSGEFDRGMQVTHAQSGRSFSTKYALTVFGRTRSTVETAYPGDIVGLVNAGSLAPGDTIYTGKKIQFPPMPQFAPEHFRTLRAKSLGKYKQFRKALDQLAAEGVVQILRNDARGDAAPVMAAVGPMQFEVMMARMENEYNVETVAEAWKSLLAQRMANSSHCLAISGNWRLSNESTRNSSSSPWWLINSGSIPPKKSCCASWRWPPRRGDHRGNS